jgi:hypothetical protein
MQFTPEVTPEVRLMKALDDEGAWKPPVQVGFDDHGGVAANESRGRKLSFEYH